MRRLLAVSKQRDIKSVKVLQLELSVVTPFLFNDDGTMKNSVKSELTNKLEASCPLVTTFSPGIKTTYLIDDTALIQGLNETF